MLKCSTTVTILLYMYTILCAGDIGSQMYLNKTKQWLIPKTTPGSVPCPMGMGSGMPLLQDEGRLEGLGWQASGNLMSCPDAAGDSVASQGVVPLWATWQLLAGEPGPASGFRTAGQATSGSAMAGFPGLERKFRRGRPRGKSVCLCRRKGRIARPVSEAPGSEVPSQACGEAARVPGRRRGAAGGRCPVLGRRGQGLRAWRESGCAPGSGRPHCGAEAPPGQCPFVDGCELRGRAANATVGM